MGLYNMLFGTNDIAPILLGALDLQHPELNPDGAYPIGRFRDISTNANGTEIILYTRNGGGNRHHWEYSYDEYEEGDTCPCPGCAITHVLPKHPNYLRDQDDDYDCTYAEIVFGVPDEYKEIIIALSTGEDLQSIGEKFQALIEAMKRA